MCRWRRSTPPPQIFSFPQWVIVTNSIAVHQTVWGCREGVWKCEHPDRHREAPPWSLLTFYQSRSIRSSEGVGDGLSVLSYGGHKDDSRSLYDARKSTLQKLLQCSTSLFHAVSIGVLTGETQGTCTPAHGEGVQAMYFAPLQSHA